MLLLEETPVAQTDRARALAFVWHADRHAKATSDLDVRARASFEQAVAFAEGLISDDLLEVADRDAPIPEPPGPLLADPCAAAAGLVAPDRALMIVCQHAVAATSRALAHCDREERGALAGMFHSLRAARDQMLVDDPSLRAVLDALEQVDGTRPVAQDELLFGGVHGHLQARARHAEQAAADLVQTVRALAASPLVDETFAEELDAIAREAS